MGAGCCSGGAAGGGAGAGLGAIASGNFSALEPLLEHLKGAVTAAGSKISGYGEPYHGDLRQLHALFLGLPALPLLIGHCCFMAALYHGPPFRYYWLLSFWISFAAGFGGGTLSSIMMQDPPIWFRDDTLILTYAICWWFIMYSPRDVGFTLFSKILPIKVACKASSNILRANIIMARVDLVVKRFGPTAVTAPIFLGTLSGCGGKLICDLAAAAFHLRKPAELAKPSWSLRSALSVSFLYTATVYWLPIFPQDVAKAALITFLVAQGLASDLTGWQLDLTEPFFSIFHALTGIPVPPEEVDPKAISTAVFEVPKKHSD